MISYEFIHHDHLHQHPTPSIPRLNRCINLEFQKNFPDSLAISNSVLDSNPIATARGTKAKHVVLPGLRAASSAVMQRHASRFKSSGITTNALPNTSNLSISPKRLQPPSAMTSVSTYLEQSSIATSDQIPPSSLATLKSPSNLRQLSFYQQHSQGLQKHQIDYSPQQQHHYHQRNAQLPPLGMSPADICLPQIPSSNQFDKQRFLPKSFRRIKQAANYSRLAVQKSLLGEDICIAPSASLAYQSHQQKSQQIRNISNNSSLVSSNTTATTVADEDDQPMHKLERSPPLAAIRRRCSPLKTEGDYHSHHQHPTPDNLHNFNAHSIEQYRHSPNPPTSPQANLDEILVTKSTKLTIRVDNPTNLRFIRRPNRLVVSPLNHQNPAANYSITIPSCNNSATITNIIESTYQHAAHNQEQSPTTLLNEEIYSDTEDQDNAAIYGIDSYVYENRHRF